MSPVLSSGSELTTLSGGRPDAAAVDCVMTVHRATFAKLVANHLDTYLIEFLEDAAATYRQLAQRLRETAPPQ